LRTVKLAPDKKQASRETELTSGQLAPPTKSEDLSVDQTRQQLQRLLDSDTLRNSLTLRQLLQFLGTRAIEGNSEGLKEYTIGLEAFGRKPDFDPKTDTIVRVQTHRLRQKLKEYYDEEGARDPVLVDIPRGHYSPTFRLRENLREHQDLDGHVVGVVSHPETNAHPSLPSDHEGAVEEKLIKSRAGVPLRGSVSGPVIAAAAVLLALIIGYFAGSYQSHPASGTDGLVFGTNRFVHQPADPVKTFWADFLGNDPAPIIAYPNAVFLLDDSNDLFRFRQGASDNRGARVDPHLAREFASNPALVANAGQLYYEDGYTGTGELEGVAMLSTLFAQMGLKPIIKTSRNITPEDLQQHSVILLGSPFQNIAVGQLLAAGDFAFQNPDARREQWRAQIVNAHPAANESPAYRTERDPETQVLKRDYSLISIQPGVVPGRNIAVLGGLDTKGTEGVTRFMTSRTGVESLSSALAAKGMSLSGIGSGGKAGGKRDMPWFQALVLVHLEKGDQVLSTELSAVHPLHLKKSPAANGEDSSAPAGK
jgi:hypothetical protein